MGLLCTSPSTLAPASRPRLRAQRDTRRLISRITRVNTMCVSGLACRPPLRAQCAAKCQDNLLCTHALCTALESCPTLPQAMRRATATFPKDTGVKYHAAIFANMKRSSTAKCKDRSLCNLYYTCPPTSAVTSRPALHAQRYTRQVLFISLHREEYACILPTATCQGVEASATPTFEDKARLHFATHITRCIRITYTYPLASELACALAPLYTA